MEKGHAIVKIHIFVDLGIFRDGLLQVLVKILLFKNEVVWLLVLLLVLEHAIRNIFFFIFFLRWRIGIFFLVNQLLPACPVRSWPNRFFFKQIYTLISHRIRLLIRPPKWIPFMQYFLARHPRSIKRFSILLPDFLMNIRPFRNSLPPRPILPWSYSIFIRPFLVCFVLSRLVHSRYVLCHRIYRLLGHLFSSLRPGPLLGH